MNNLINDGLVERSSRLIDLSADDSGGTGETYAHIAVVGEVDARIQRRHQDRLALLHINHLLETIVNNGDLECLFGEERSRRGRW